MRRNYLCVLLLCVLRAAWAQSVATDPSPTPVPTASEGCGDPSPAAPPDPSQGTGNAPEAKWWSLHFQATSIGQEHGSFPSPYEGANSLPAHPEKRVSRSEERRVGKE